MGQQTANGNRHLWIMLLCCLIPVVALAAIFILGIPVDQVLVFALILLCPLSHFLLMGRGGHEHGKATSTGAHLTTGVDNPKASGEKGTACQ